MFYYAQGYRRLLQLRIMHSLCRWQEVSREKDVALRKHVQENESLNFRNQQVILKKNGNVLKNRAPWQDLVYNSEVLGEAVLI